MTEPIFIARPCPKCGHDDVWNHTREVAVMQDGACLVTWQDGSECANCGERWSTAAQCNEADDRLMAMGWKARGMR